MKKNYQLMCFILFFMGGSLAFAQLDSLDTEQLFLLRDTEYHLNEYFQKPNPRDKELVFRYVNRSISMDSTWPVPHRKLAFAEAHLNQNFEKARKHWLAYIRHTHQGEAWEFDYNPYLFIATMDILTYRFEEASTYADSAKQYNDVMAVRKPKYLKGWAYLLMGLYQQAGQEWQDIVAVDGMYYRNKYFNDHQRYFSIKSDKAVLLRIWDPKSSREKPLREYQAIQDDAQVDYPICQGCPPKTFEISDRVALSHPFFFSIDAQKGRILDEFPQLDQDPFYPLLEVEEEAYQLVVFYLDAPSPLTQADRDWRIQAGKTAFTLSKASQIKTEKAGWIFLKSTSDYDKKAKKTEYLWASVKYSRGQSFLILGIPKDPKPSPKIYSDMQQQIETFQHSIFPTDAFRF